MTHELPIIEARNKLTSLPEQFENNPEIGAIAVTRRGKPVLAVMSWDLYESIIETMDIMSNPELLKALRQSIKEAEAGKTIPWQTVKTELGL